LKAARVSGAGVVLDPSGFAIASAASDIPAVASNGRDYFVVWTDTRSGNSDIYGARVSASGSVLDGTGVPISTASGAQGYPAITWDGARYVVVWEDARNGDKDIYLARVSPAGSVVDAEGIAIATGSLDDREPHVASDGTNSLVAWARGSGVYGARVSHGREGRRQLRLCGRARRERVPWLQGGFVAKLRERRASFDAARSAHCVAPPARLAQPAFRGLASFVAFQQRDPGPMQHRFSASRQSRPAAALGSGEGVAVVLESRALGARSSRLRGRLTPLC
jgi:hypothetical protein